MREPAVHITEAQLVEFLKRVTPRENDHKMMAKTILIYAKQYALSHRTVISTNQQIEKKADKIRLTSKSEAGMFAQLLHFSRRKLKHRGIHLIKSGTPEWLSMKEVCKLGTEFCNEFKLALKEGYLIYLNLALPKMKLFSLSKFKNLHQVICEEYEANKAVEDDDNPDMTKNCHDFYMSLIADRTGNTVGYSKQPDKYKFFIEVRKQAKEIGLGWKDYIIAQFAALEWANAFPDPAQLIGIKALQRVEKWAFQKNIKLGEKEKVIDFSKIQRKKL